MLTNRTMGIMGILTPDSHGGEEAPAPASSEQPVGGFAPGLAGTSLSSLVTPPAKRDQTLFIHYYKMKRRLWLFQAPMEAAAGPHELPPGPDDDGEMRGTQASDDSGSRDFEEATIPPGSGVSLDALTTMSSLFTAISDI